MPGYLPIETIASTSSLTRRSRCGVSGILHLASACFSLATPPGVFPNRIPPRTASSSTCEGNLSGRPAYHPADPIAPDQPPHGAWASAVAVGFDYLDVLILPLAAFDFLDACEDKPAAECPSSPRPQSGITFTRCNVVLQLVNSGEKPRSHPQTWDYTIGPTPGKPFRTAKKQNSTLQTPREATNMSWRACGTLRSYIGRNALPQPDAFCRLSLFWSICVISRATPNRLPEDSPGNLIGDAFDVGRMCASLSAVRTEATDLASVDNVFQKSHDYHRIIQAAWLPVDAGGPSASGTCSIQFALGIAARFIKQGISILGSLAHRLGRAGAVHQPQSGLPFSMAKASRPAQDKRDCGRQVVPDDRFPSVHQSCWQPQNVRWHVRRAVGCSTAVIV